MQPNQDLITLHNIDVSVSTNTPAKAVKLVPSGKSLDFIQKDGVVAFTVPSVTGHEMEEIAY